MDTPSSDLTINKDSAVNCTGTASGGLPPYTFWWHIDGIGGSASEDQGQIYFNAAGTYTIIFYVQDSLGAVALDRTLVTVTSSSAAVTTSVHITTPSSNLTVPAGTSVDFTREIVGSASPFVVWWNFGDIAGSPLEDPGFMTFDTPGSYMIIFYARDSLGTVVSDSVIVVVTDA